MIDEYIKLADERTYPSKREWFFKYGKHGVDYEKLLTYKKRNLTSIPLQTVEGSLYFKEDYVVSKMKDFYSVQNDLETMDRLFREFEQIMIFSEVEGTLEIEGVKTSKKKIAEVMMKKTSLDTKEQIIRNMKNGIDYILKHDISEENIHALYGILSFQSLADDEKIEKGYYRMKDVDIIGSFGEISDRGVEAKYLAPWMKDFVSFIQESMSSLNSFTYLMPHIIHYYIVYLHPYYDFNGRMARLLSYWYILKCPFIKEKLPVFSEAINYNSNTKSLYYRAIENSREDDNDLTFFFDYLFSVGVKFAQVYQKMGVIAGQSRRGLSRLTTPELNILKSILLYVKEHEFFIWEDVSYYDKQQYSKQYYFDLLNSLVKKEILSLTVKGKTHYFKFVD